jgi:flagellar hook-associated protein 2
MSTGISFSGVGSGLPVDTWIEQLVAAQRSPIDKLYLKKDTLNKTQTTLNSVESSFRSLKTSVEKLTDANIISSLDIFNSRKATSTDSNIATVTAANGAAMQQISLSVEKLATATKASSVNLAQSIDGSELFTSIANKQGTLGLKHADGSAYGTFSIYTDGVKHSITVEKDDTVNNIIKKINDEFDPNDDGDYSDNSLSVSLTNGRLALNYNNAEINQVSLGNTADTTNFFNIMQLSTATATNNGNGTSTFTSVSQISKINLAGTIVGNAANLNVTGDPITAGTFKIGKAEFTIDNNTTLATLVSRINANSDAGVLAQVDTKTNKLIITSKTAGKNAINFEDGTSNFLSKVGLISPTGDSLASQTLGENARVFLNGSNTALEVNSNTITGDISGIPGLTINLKKVTTSVATNGTTVNNPININVEQDTDQIVNSINDFITSYNKVMTDVAGQTAKAQPLHGEYTLINIKNSIRTLTANRVSGLTDFDSLGVIGISTGAVGKSVKSTSSTLSLDKTKLAEALQKDPEQVKALLVGDKKLGITGVFQKLEGRLDNVLDPVNGYFESRGNSIEAMIASAQKSITKGEDRLAAYRKQVTKQFSDMDSYISKMQQQSSSLSAIR